MYVDVIGITFIKINISPCFIHMFSLSHLRTFLILLLFYLQIFPFEYEFEKLISTNVDL